jgi:hypothetical protein
MAVSPTAHAVDVLCIRELHLAARDVILTVRDMVVIIVSYTA